MSNVTFNSFNLLTPLPLHSAANITYSNFGMKFLFRRLIASKFHAVFPSFFSIGVIKNSIASEERGGDEEVGKKYVPIFTTQNLANHKTPFFHH